MQLVTLAETSAAVAATSSRLAKRALLAEAIGAAGDDLALAVTYLSGSLRQRRTGVGWAGLAEIPPPAATATLTLPQVDATFEGLAGQAGAGSAVRRSAAVRELFGAATAIEQAFLRGIVFDDIRQGALDAQVQDALAVAFGLPAAAVRRAAMLLGSTAAAAETLRTGGSAALAAVTLAVGRGVRPMLAASAPDAAQAATKAGLPAVVDAKLDGIRVQVHRDGDAITVFTRSLDDITARVPEIVAAVRALPDRRVVLDGEALALGPAGRPLAFQVTAGRAATDVTAAPGTRGGRPDGGEPVSDPDQVRLSLFCFDLLHRNGTNLLDAPLTERAAALAAAVPPGMIVPRRRAETVQDVETALADALAAGFEGVVVKDPAAPYAAGRRDSGWVKLKPRHTFDLAVLGAEWGYGRRTGWLSNLHLAAHGADGGWVMLGKTFKGLTDQMLRWQTEQILQRETRRTAHAVFADPPLVAEIAIDGLQRSTRYPGGVALRFARVVRYRDDKAPADVDTLATVLALGEPPPR